MATAKIQHEYACSADAFWKDIIFDEKFNQQLYLDHLKFKEWRMESFDEDEDEIRRTVAVHPVTGDLPKPLAKIAGDNLGYKEKGVFDKKAKRYRFEVIPNRLANKLTITGEIHVEPRGDDRCERTLDLRVDAKIFGVGSMVEKRIIEDTRQSYDKSHAFSQQYLTSR
jgi:hypothetical protein